MTGVFRGIRIGDYALAGVLTALGVLLMEFDVRSTDASVARQVADGSMVHALSSHSPVDDPGVRRRHGPGAVVAAQPPRRHRGRNRGHGPGLCPVRVGDTVRRRAPACPRAVFLVALTYDRAKASLAAGLTALLAFAVVVVDATTGPNVIGLVLPVMLIVFGIGWAVRRRAALNRELKARDAELRRLRDERAVLVITDDRAQLSQQLDGLLQERLAQLTTVAESADGLGPEQAKALLESIETDSRRTLDDMREIVGLLRGGDPGSDPHSLGRTPRRTAGPERQSAHARLTVTETRCLRRRPASSCRLTASSSI